MKRWKPTAKTGLVTHKGCLDGTGAALMFLWAGGKKENILFRNPSTCDLTPEEAAPFDEVWFADLCPSNIADPAGGKPFHVFDHHPSNARKFADNPNTTFSMIHSGTSLFGEMLGVYDEAWGDLQPRYDDGDDSDGYRLHRFQLVKALEAYDLGRFDDKNGMYLADLAASYSQDEMLDLLYRVGTNVFSLSEERGRVAALSSMRNLYAEAATRSVTAKDLDGVKCGLAFSPVYWKNEVAQRILSQGYEMAVIFEPTGMVSLRSLPGGPDCSMIAGRYGGGGHPRAAGFKVSSVDLATAAFDEVFG